MNTLAIFAINYLLIGSLLFVFIINRYLRRYPRSAEAKLMSGVWYIYAIGWTMLCWPYALAIGCRNIAKERGKQ